MPVLTAAGYQVVTFDNRGVSPSSSPPAPYSIDAMVADTIGLLDHLEMGSVRIAGHSMGGWVAETLAIRHPDRVRGRSPHGELQRGDGLGDDHHHGGARPGPTRLRHAVALYYAAETLRYLPNHELQDDAVVEAWLGRARGPAGLAQPGRLGQYEACLAWSADHVRTEAWSTISVPCLVLAFEHDIDSPPARARQAAGPIPGARYVEIAGASHLGIFTHGPEVGRALVEFFSAR